MSGRTDDSGDAKLQDKSLQNDLLENNDTSIFGVLVSAYRSAISGIFWVLYGLHHDTSMPLPVFASFLFVETLQWASLVFFDHGDVDWNRSAWTTWLFVGTSWAANFFGKAVPGIYAALAWTYALPVMCALAMACYKYFQWIWTMTVLRTFFVLSSRIMFFPVMSSLIRVIFGCIQTGSTHNVYITELACSDSRGVALALVSIVGFIIFLGMMLIFAACYFEINPNQRKDMGDRESADARSSGRGDFYYTLLRALAIMIFTIFTQFNGHKWPLSVTLVVIGGILLKYDYQNLPYFNPNAQIMAVFLHISILWGGICMCISNITGPESLGAVYLYIFTSTTLLIISTLFVRMRNDQVCHFTLQVITNAPHAFHDLRNCKLLYPSIPFVLYEDLSFPLSLPISKFVFMFPLHIYQHI